MAEIRIEKKKGTNWLWIILGALLLALLAWWLLGRDTDGDRERVAGGDVTTAPAVAAPAAAASGDVITDWTMVAASSSGDLAGRRVELTGVPVIEAVSDRGFWIGNASARAFVVRGNQSLPSTAPDGAVDAGTTVRIWGTVVRMPTELTEQNTEWKLRDTDRDALGRQAAYVMADSVRLESR
ncbi:MAG: hypothetical protein MUF21_03480 [Gemmatimonadaceae bacterium]|nr:hypothetical protein [Gemmatimonadaceae bacterium]